MERHHAEEAQEDVEKRESIESVTFAIKDRWRSEHTRNGHETLNEAEDSALFLGVVVRC